MRLVATLIAMLPVLATGLVLAAPPLAHAQPIVGQFEVKAYSKIPKTKTAVQLTIDSAMGRQLRREVMIRLSRRGNEVGFSGGNVMRMDVTYSSFLSGGSGSSTIDPGREVLPLGDANPRPPLPDNRIAPFDSGGSTPTLRITLSLYSTDGGRVLWQAVSTCKASSSNVIKVGEAMIDTIFNNADNNRVADAGCPI
jgi:hypothetical protein